eukprot:XP_017945631.1 PREDICTED: E3 ubiquitin/ISG15 ligase TRIM25-like [Xenopus tropicalis]
MLGWYRGSNKQLNIHISVECSHSLSVSCPLHPNTLILCNFPLNVLLFLSGMASTDLREELNCSICLSIYTHPVTLPCGHSFCQGCIGRVLDTQKRCGLYTCPDCRAKFKRRPALQRNRTLGNIAERFLPGHPKPGQHGIFCTYCVYSPVPAAKSCLLCEASLCETHLKVHSQAAEHLLTQPTTSFLERKCSGHRRILEYYCCQDGAPICVSCCLAGEHRGHRVEPLSEASEKKKEKLRKVLEKLSPEREETEREAQRLQERRREVQERALGETERVTALFRDIREQLEALEKQVLGDISRQKRTISLQLCDLLNQMETKNKELTGKIRHIEELCNMEDPLAVLQERESDAFCGAEKGDKKRRRTSSTDVPDVGDLKLLVSKTLLTGLVGIVTTASYGQEATDMSLDINTAANDVSVSEDGKMVSGSQTDQCHPQTPERFEFRQVLSTKTLAAAHKHLPLGGSDHEEAPVGTNVTLRCNFTADPGVGLGDLSAHWIKDGDTIFFVNKTYTYPKSVGAHIKEELQKGEASLPLSDVTKEDAGKYTCAINPG